MRSVYTTNFSRLFSRIWFKIFFLFSITIVFTNIGLSQTWTEDWEGNWTVNWHVDNGTWEVGTPTSGPDSAYNGLNCAATVLGGDYSEPVDSRLIRHSSFVVPPASENPRLRFWYWFSFNLDDWGEVQIKTNSGDWESISNMMENYGSTSWSYGMIDISSYSGDTVQIAFHFHSQPHYYYGDVSSGWYIDDVSLMTGAYVFNNPEGFESGFGDWSADEGSWEVGIPTSGPDSAYNGVNCAGTNLEGNYQEPADSRLITPPFVIPPASENPAIQFWHWFSFAEDDWGEIQITTDRGFTWETISNQFNNTSSGAWTSFYISLSQYANTTAQIAFHFHSQLHYYYGDVSSGWYVDEVMVSPYIVGIENNYDTILPKFFELSQNYPNPFNPTTRIKYEIPKTSFVTIKVYDVLGKQVATLVNEEKIAGNYEVDFDARRLSSGIYFYNLQTGSFVETKKMILLK